MAINAAAPSVVGRDDELAALSGVLDDPGGFPIGVVIEGEAGIGKTTLWEYGVRAARMHGYEVLSCRPAAAETEFSFAGLGDLLERRLVRAISPLPAPQRRVLRAALLIEEPDGRLDRRAVAVAFLNAVRELEQERPVVVAVDDVQWLDGATAGALEFAARRLDERRVALLLARRALGERLPPLGLDRALAPERVSFVRLGPLSLGAVHYLLHTRLGTVLPRPALRRLHELSGGNPFYALELGRAVERGNIGLEPAEKLPARLSELVSERVAALPRETRRTLAAAAALSRPMIELLDPVAEGRSRATLAAAAAAGVAEIEDDEVRFSHPLLGSAAYALAPRDERRDLHRRLADVVKDPEERARHLALATGQPDEHIARVVEDGAGVAFRRGAPGAAAELAAQAVRLTPISEAEAARRRALAEAEYHFEAGDTKRAAAILEQAIATAVPGPERAYALSRLARVRHFAEDVGWGVDLLGKALAEAGDDGELRAGIEEGLAWGLLLMRKDLHAAAAHARSAVRFAEERGDRAALAEALAAAALTEFILGRDPDALMERALALEPSTLHLRVLRHPSFACAYWLTCCDEHDRARAVFQELRRRATEQGDESALPAILNHLTLIECFAGAWDTAEDYAEEGYAIALQSAQGPSQASILSKKALVQACRGAVEDARETLGSALAIAGGPAFDLAQPERALARGGETAIWTLGFLELSLGRPEEAHRCLGPLAEALLGAGIREPGELRFLPDEIETLVVLGKLAEAETRLVLLEDIAQSLCRPSALAAAARSRGLLCAAHGELGSALPALAEALTQHGRVAMPFDRGRTLLAIGQTHRRLKHKRAAREALEQALAIFDGLGARLWAEKTRSEIERIGGRTSAGRELTATEGRVAELVAAGRSNKEVAAQLFVTVRAVERNLTRIYAKLGIRSRAELIRRFASGKDP